MTKGELLEENQELRATLQAIFDQIAAVLGIDTDDFETFEDDETSA